MKSVPLNSPLLIIVLLVVAAMFGTGAYLIKIDTDITKYLPQNDPVVSDAGYIFKNHPIQDQVIIDISVQKAAPDTLVECGDLVEQRLRDSGMFRHFGMKEAQGLIPDLVSHILNDLPVMFTEKEIHNQIKPLLHPDRIHERLRDARLKLLDLDGIGQAQFISKDPLGLKDIVLARLSLLAPSEEVEIYKGKLISSDKRHLILVATPLSSGTDTAFARKIEELIGEISDELDLKQAPLGNRVRLTPIGAYRAALDNELIVKHDVEGAILFATIGIALLLIFAFPRPVLGLFAFLPALAGTITAFFLFSILQESVSLMALGFGGAIISITVDHGIAFLLFLDRSHQTLGREASRETWAVGLVAALTTIGAFGALYFCDFPIFKQVGQFTALGIAFSFIFVHTVFPKIFPSMPPARSRALPLRAVVGGFASAGKPGAYAALVFGVVMLFFARPDFNVNLSSMNTVSKETSAAEGLFTEVWGKNFFNKVHLMTEGKSLRELQKKGDKLLETIDQDPRPDLFSSCFVPAMIFPGEDRGGRNFAAWKRFWNNDRITRLKRTLKRAAADNGFKADSFKPFYETISVKRYQPAGSDIPEKFFDLLGISESPDRSLWVQFSSLTPGKSYDAQRFYDKYSLLGKIFDPAFFSKRLGGLLFSAFVKMLVIIGLSIFALLFFFFLDWKLTFVALLPVLFALISTLGTLKLIGHPLDIPGLMLSIVVIGMGIDYSLFFVRSHQRYYDDSGPSFGIIRMAVFMAASSTIIGFGVLCFAQHSLLMSAGLTSLLGIGYSLIGAFIILPPVLKHLFHVPEKDTKRDEKSRDRILRRYKNMEPYPRLFARFKMMSDPMFEELSRLFDPSWKIRTIIDIGCGYGVPACWLLERFPEARVYAIDPDPERVRIACRAFGKRGLAERGRAPDIPPKAPYSADTALMLDMMHFITDDELRLTLRRLHDRLRDKGRLFIRAVIAPKNHPSWSWRFQTMKLKISGTPSYFRSVERIRKMIMLAGFRVEYSSTSGSNEESVWFIAEAIE